MWITGKNHKENRHSAAIFFADSATKFASRFTRNSAPNPVAEFDSSASVQFTQCFINHVPKRLRELA